VIAPSVPQPSHVAGFRTRLVIAMMLVISSVTLLALYFTQRQLAQNVAEALDREFQGELDALHHAQDVRRAALVERCRALVRKPRIHAALEDDALDLLYLSAEDELRDVMVPESGNGAGRASPQRALQAEFYRFLDRKGRVISPSRPRSVGLLEPTADSRLALPGLVDRPQIGYLARPGAAGGPSLVYELIAMPINSMESGETIAMLVLGFKPFELREREASGMESGIWVDGRVHGIDLPPNDAAMLARHLAAGGENRITLGGAPHWLLTKRLNPESQYTPAFEVCVYPLAGLVKRQRQLRWQVLGAGGLLLLVGLAGSQVLAGRLSRPVEKLAVDSKADRAERQKVEAALEMTSAELQRSARFSADASHQLKTPVTVLRAGLEEMLARENLTPEECHEISALIHQTFRLSTLIEDLLLLSRLDAGRLKLQVCPVNFTQLIEASLDDLSAVPDEVDIAVETDFPSDLLVFGEKRYTSIILQNLLENARKYNRPGGRIRVSARVEENRVKVVIANTGPAIPANARGHIFERFHRGAVGENVPGYGLGLNLARELARLHRGELSLTRSDLEWTEFELTLPWAEKKTPA